MEAVGIRHIQTVVGVSLAAVEEHSWNSFLVLSPLLLLPVQYQSPPGSSSSTAEMLFDYRSETPRHLDLAELMKSVRWKDVHRLGFSHVTFGLISNRMKKRVILYSLQMQRYLHELPW